MNFVEDVIRWVHLHQHFAFAAVFLLAFLESLPIAGSFVPGASAIIAIAAILPKNADALLPALLAAIAGASLGDGFSFWFGHRYEQRIVNAWPMKNYPRLVTRGENFVKEHGVKSVILARFTPPVRALVPLFAGILEMPARQYAAANIVAAIAWGFAHVGFGAFVGHSASFIEGKFGRYALIALAVIAAAALAYWHGRKRCPQ